MDFSKVKAIKIPEGYVKKIVTNRGGVTLWEVPYVNMVPLSIDTDGSIYNGGLGYKNGYRVRSGGTEASSNNGACTGFIPVNGGDVVRISGVIFSYAQNGNAINVADSSFTNIGQFTMLPAQYGIFARGAAYAAYAQDSVVEESDGVWKWVVPPAASGVAYIRVSGQNSSGTSPGANLIVTVNEEIT